VIAKNVEEVQFVNIIVGSGFVNSVMEEDYVNLLGVKQQKTKNTKDIV
jgi:hypothetical protein